MAHYNYFSELIPGNENAQKLALAVLLGAALVAFGAAVTKRIRGVSQAALPVVPDKKITPFGFFDAFIEGFIKYHDSILGPENRHHVPFTGTIFIFILSANLIGLIPGMPAATTTVWVNVAMALVVFFHFNWEGIKANGVFGYVKHFAGPVIWLSWFIFPLEIFSTLLRILTLNLRLYWNINADHMVLGIATDLVPYLVPMMAYALGTFVAFMQAFVFTTLTMVYILLATQHEEEH